MDPIAVEALLLRRQLPELTLRPGVTLLARVASRGEQHAVLVLAGVPLTAKVPEEVQTGETLRLKVQEVTPERVTLRLDPVAPPPAAAPAPAPPPPPASVTVQDPPARRRGTDGRPVHTVALAFHSPVLGRLDLRVELGGDRVLAAVEAPGGAPFERARGAAEALEAALAGRTGLTAAVQVRPRREPLDVYA
jgi:hypothetical protein